VPLVVYMHARFEFLVSPIPEIWRGPKIQKVGHVTPPDPI